MKPTAPTPPAAPGSGGAPAAEGVRSAPAAALSPEPYPGYQAELAALEARAAAARRAAAAPLPGPLREAFAGEPVTVHGFTLQPVTMGLHPILVRIGSPLLEVIRIMREELTRADGADESTPALLAAAREARLAKALRRIETEIKAEEETLVETVFAFLRPVAEIRALLNQGRAVFRETALRQVADKLHPAQFAELQRAVSTHYSASFATALSYQAPKEESDKGTVFTMPPLTATASGGGSTSSEP